MDMDNRDNEIREDIWECLSSGDLFEDLSEDNKNDIAEYIFNSYGYLFKDDEPGKSPNRHLDRRQRSHNILKKREIMTKPAYLVFLPVCHV